MKLNLGCGPSKKEGYWNVDRRASAHPDQVWDLEQLPWPWETSSVDEIFMSHVLEHLGADHKVFFGIITELYRVMKPEGKVVIKVPHHRCDNFWGDPTHVRAVTPKLMSLFDKKLAKDWLDCSIADPEAGFALDVDLEIVQLEAALSPRWKKKFEAGELTTEALQNAEQTFNNVVDEVTYTLKVHK